MSPTEPQAPSPILRRAVVAGGVVVAGLAIAAGFWLSNAGPGVASDCPVQVEAGRAIDDAATGLLAALNGTGEGRGYADMAFQDEAGETVMVGDFAGRTLLVNFWASWCVPCREEMPDLEAIAARYNGDDFMVLPINLDLGEEGLGKARAFIDEYDWPNLPLYADSSFEAFERLRREAVAIGLPATLVLDAEGCELAVLQGPAHWDSADGERVVEAMIAHNRASAGG